jgi:hypothetical protein
MSENRKAALNSLLALGSLLVTALFWENAVATVLMLSVIGALVFLIRPSRSTAVVYFVAFIFGPLAESLAITHGAWQYADPQLGSIPVWLPFLWGNAGLFLVNTEKLSFGLLRKRGNRGN